MLWMHWPRAVREREIINKLTMTYFKVTQELLEIKNWAFGEICCHDCKPSRRKNKYLNLMRRIFLFLSIKSLKTWQRNFLLHFWCFSHVNAVLCKNMWTRWALIARRRMKCACNKVNVIIIQWLPAKNC